MQVHALGAELGEQLDELDRRQHLPDGLAEGVDTDVAYGPQAEREAVLWSRFVRHADIPPRSGGSGSPPRAHLPYPAMAMARSGRSRNGGSHAGMFENGNTSGWSAIPRVSAMKPVGPGSATTRGVPRANSDRSALVGQREAVLDVRREVLGPGRGDHVHLERHARTQLDRRSRRDRRVDPLVQVDLVPRVQEDPEERVAEPACTISCSTPPVWPIRSAPYHSAIASK